jgi:hypothetical protein
MNVRNFEQRDIEEIKAIHARRGLGFELPDLTRKMAVEKLFCHDDKIVMAAILRPTTEAYVICDPEWKTPWFRWQALQELHDAVLRECREKGIEDTQAVLDPPIEKAFGRRLLQLGWSRHLGTLYSRRAAD